MSGYTDIENNDHADIRLMGPLDLVEPEAVEQAVCFFDHPEVAEHSQQMILNADLHPGADIPVGVTLDLENHLIPRMIGRDIGCGMRLEVLPITQDEIEARIHELKNRLRAIFFHGQRNLMLSPNLRESIFRYGLPALGDDMPLEGLFSKIDGGTFSDNLKRVHAGGSFPSETCFSLYADYIQSSAVDSNELTADSQLGSLGGGNHFCEIGVVEDLFEGATARSWGLLPGSVVLFTHSGSLSTGAAVGNHFTGNQHSAVLNEEEAKSFISAMNNATNFAFANRFALSLMARKAISESLGKEIESELVWDAPHNFIESADGVWRHHKGSTPAEGSSTDHPSGHPVLLPGSMGTASYVLVGNGDLQSGRSVAHGAGRKLARGVAARKDFDPTSLNIVTPINRQDIINQGRRDMLIEDDKRIREEAPHAYKDIEAVVSAIETAQAARKVSSLKPILTVKA